MKEYKKIACVLNDDKKIEFDEIAKIEGLKDVKELHLFKELVNFDCTFASSLQDKCIL